MLAKLDQFYRMLATGFCFASFGLGGLVLRVLVFPMLQLCVRDHARRTALARETVRLSFRTFVAMMQGVGVLRYEVVGAERLEREGLLILANHPSLIDTVFLMAWVRHADCIVKSHLRDNPFTRGPVRAANYIANDGGPEMVDACIDSLRAGGNLIVFPEGTRTPPGGELAFKRGAANIAVRGRRAVTPVVIHCEPPTLGKGERWWQVPPRRVRFRIEVMEDIPVGAPAEGQSEAVAARHLTGTLQEFFSQERYRHA
jgi:1-acyl-sn-glycerol-3-phosphate acyltransferase